MTKSLGRWFAKLEPYRISRSECPSMAADSFCQLLDDQALVVVMNSEYENREEGELRFQRVAKVARRNLVIIAPPVIPGQNEQKAREHDKGRAEIYLLSLA
jgi:hypothetical protein